ncbi:MAG: type II toxin-antitoxin system VapC family toxin [Candidatus Scalindua sp.]
MITAVDTNILIDILFADKKHFADSKAVIDTHNEQGQLIISEVVYAELACQFASEIELKEFLSDTSIKLVLSSEKALSLAGERWKGYSKRKKKGLQCSGCGKFVTVHCENCNSIISSRQSMVSDFMIGSHALNHADLLLSRDRGFYKTYFKDIDVKNKI